MYYHKNLKKFIATVVIVAFIFQSNIFSLYQEKDEDLIQLEKSIDAYLAGQDDSSKIRLERLIGTIKAKGLEVEKKDILGKCYLLIGAISEKKGEILLAEENYRKAKEEYGVEAIEGVDLDGLTIYKKVVKVEIEISEGIKEQEIIAQLKKAINDYNERDYESTKKRIDRIKREIKIALDWKDILGKCYLLLGAISEKKGDTSDAEENYRRAKKEYGVESIEGVDLDDLPIYKRVVKGIIEEEDGKGIKKKKFPVLLVIGGLAAVAVVVMLLTKKKEEPPPFQNTWFITSTDSLKYNMDVPEGGTATFDVRLSAQPTSEVSASVARIGGDTDISVQSGSSLTFTTANWNQNQTVTLAAKEDSDVSSDIAIIRIYAPGFADKDITVDEQDNDRLSIETNTDIVIVKEGQTATFQVRLSHQCRHGRAIHVSVSRVNGDTDINVQSGGNLNFTSNDWNIYRTVTLISEEDSDTTDGIAIFRIYSSAINPSKDITAIEDDNDGNPLSILNTYPPNEENVSYTGSMQTYVSAPD
ncbi:MAG: hypothetical protein JSV88_07390 [Candidatus Aminicenantes bacterium]|nr:MAG: hypothetical protein JSV88_07390 [Candidatus Aminicenantes bacterium]